DNPGTVADLHELARNSQPVCFDGLKVISNKTVNTQLLMGHHLQMGKRDRNVYRLNLTYLRDMNVHPLTGMSAITIDSKSIIIIKFLGESMSEVVAELDSRGGFCAGMNQFLSKRLRCKSSMTFAYEGLQHYQMIADLLGRDYTLSCMLSDLMPYQKTGIFVASYLKHVTPRLELGWEIIMQPSNEPNLFSCVGRYTRGPCLLSATVNSNAAELCYTQTFGGYLRAGTQIQANFVKRSLLAKIYYHMARPETDFNFRGGIDTRGVISATCEKHLKPLPMILVISAKLNHRSNRFRLGVGVVLE
ncbi:hypothetical protein KR067_005393, partial [Drosophila pandora]